MTIFFIFNTLFYPTLATKKVYLNTIAQVAGKISTALISIFLIKILTNYLDVAGYGLYSKIYNYLSIFSVIADLGLYTITVREISDNKDNPEKVRMIAGNVLTLRTLMGLVIIVFSLVVGWFLPGYNSKVAMIGILISGVFTLFGLVNSSIMSLLQAYLRTEFSFVSVTTGKVVNLLAMLAVVFMILPRPFPNPMMNSFPFEEAAFTLVMLAGLAGNIVMTAMLYIYSRRVEKVGFRIDPNYIKHILKISLPYGLALFLNVVYFKVDLILLSILEPRSVADTNIALYSVPMKMVEVGMMFGTLFLNSMLPVFTEAFKDKDTGKLLEYIAKAYRVLLTFGVGIALFLFVSGREVIALMANRDYIEHTKYVYTSLDAMRIVVFVFLFYFLSSLFTYLLIASNEQKKLLRINTIITIANLAGNLVLIPFYSFVGSAAVTLFCQILLFIFTYRATRHIARFDFLPRFTVGVLGFGMVAGITSHFLLPHLAHLPLIITVGIITILFAVIYLGGIVLVFGRHYLKKPKVAD